MSDPHSRLGSITGRDKFIIAEALTTALIALEQLSKERQPVRNISDFKILFGRQKRRGSEGARGAISAVSLHHRTACVRFVRQRHRSSTHIRKTRRG
jgi:hypothetical protein